MQRPKWRNKFNITNRDVTIITLARAASPNERGSVKYNNCVKNYITKKFTTQ